MSFEASQNMQSAASLMDSAADRMAGAADEMSSAARKIQNSVDELHELYSDFKIFMTTLKDNSDSGLGKLLDSSESDASKSS